MKKLIVVLLLLPVILFSEEFILVKQIWGDVKLIQSDNKKSDLVVYSTIKFDNSIELLNKESKVWIRDNNHNDLIIEFDKVSNFSYDDIKNLIIKSNSKEIKDQSFVNKFLSLISMPKNENKNQINGMLVSSKTGVSRNLNDTNITLLEDVLILEGLPFKFDFSNLISDDISTYSIMINDKWSKKRLFEFETTESYFEFENQNIKGSLGINWELKISNSKNSKSILSNISSLYLSFESQKLLDELKEKAINEIGSKESLFQMIFIEVLLSKDLDVNASYYLDFFDLKK